MGLEARFNGTGLFNFRGYNLINGTPESYFQLTFGTSVACAHVAGVVALLKVTHTE